MSMPSTCQKNVSKFFYFIDTLNHDPREWKTRLVAAALPVSSCGMSYYRCWASSMLKATEATSPDMFKRISAAGMGRANR